MNSADILLSKIQQQIKNTDLSGRFSVRGEIIKLMDGVALVAGLNEARFNEIVQFSNGIQGLVMDLSRDNVGVLILGNMAQLEIGDSVESTGEVMSIPLGEMYLGRVVDGFGQVIDGGAKFDGKYEMGVIEYPAPGVMDRKPVNRPLETGIKAIDTMIPIGRGQRELIIGDRQTGKTSIILDTFLHQKNTDVICIYVAIGQKNAKVKQISETLKEYGINEKCIIVNASSSEPAVMQYLAPYVGCRIGEYFRDRGQDVLIAYDDLSKHAIAYREISLLLHRPPAREAYPGDIFYLHSRLLERAGQLNETLGGGSLTAFPVVETLEGDISAYIPTNIISITDGQIFLDMDLFTSGVKPAIDVGLSVSRVGGAAQSQLMKRFASKLRVQLANFRELAKFLQFGSDIDADTEQQIHQGQIFTELLKQQKYAPIAVYQQIILLYAGINGYLSDMNLGSISQREKTLLFELETKHKDLISQLKDADTLTPALEKEIKKLIKNTITLDTV
ncbi:ATP synthase subunit alpha [candidate division SR1 bacterium]|nr:ATP synthase subunit alpha [candidate division SR1 bacterium]